MQDSLLDAVEAALGELVVASADLLPVDADQHMM